MMTDAVRDSIHYDPGHYPSRWPKGIRGYLRRLRCKVLGGHCWARREGRHLDVDYDYDWLVMDCRHCGLLQAMSKRPPGHRTRSRGGRSQVEGDPLNPFGLHEPRADCHATKE